MNSTSEYWQTAQGAIQLQKLQTEFVDLYTRGRIPLTVVCELAHMLLLFSALSSSARYGLSII